MTQALYAHMNNKTIKKYNKFKKEKENSCQIHSLSLSLSLSFFLSKNRLLFNDKMFSSLGDMRILKVHVPNKNVSCHVNKKFSGLHGEWHVQCKRSQQEARVIQGSCLL
jgi:hypothetical protein